jgi:hypothetical protein
MARENVARALALRVEAGACDLPEARRLARMILHDNPVAIFRLEGALGPGGAKGRPEAGAPRAKKHR